MINGAYVLLLHIVLSTICSPADSVTAFSDGRSDQSDKEACIICYVPYKKGEAKMEMPCGSRHSETVHPNCLFKWHNAADSFSCPLCRQNCSYSCDVCKQSIEQADELRHYEDCQNVHKFHADCVSTFEESSCLCSPIRVKVTFETIDSQRRPTTVNETLFFTLFADWPDVKQQLRSRAESKAKERLRDPMAHSIVRATDGHLTWNLVEEAGNVLNFIKMKLITGLRIRVTERVVVRSLVVRLLASGQPISCPTMDISGEHELIDIGEDCQRRLKRNPYDTPVSSSQLAKLTYSDGSHKYVSPNTVVSQIGLSGWQSLELHLDTLRKVKVILFDGAEKVPLSILILHTTTVAEVIACYMLKHLDAFNQLQYYGGFDAALVHKYGTKIMDLPRTANVVKVMTDYSQDDLNILLTVNKFKCTRVQVPLELQRHNGKREYNSGFFERTSSIKQVVRDAVLPEFLRGVDTWSDFKPEHEPILERYAVSLKSPEDETVTQVTDLETILFPDITVLWRCLSPTTLRIVESQKYIRFTAYMNNYGNVTFQCPAIRYSDSWRTLEDIVQQCREESRFQPGKRLYLEPYLNLLIGDRVIIGLPLKSRPTWNSLRRGTTLVIMVSWSDSFTDICNVTSETDVTLSEAVKFKGDQRIIESTRKVIDTLSEYNHSRFRQLNTKADCFGNLFKIIYRTERLPNNEQRPVRITVMPNFVNITSSLYVHYFDSITRMWTISVKLRQRGLTNVLPRLDLYLNKEKTMMYVVRDYANYYPLLHLLKRQLYLEPKDIAAKAYRLGTKLLQMKRAELLPFLTSFDWTNIGMDEDGELILGGWSFETLWNNDASDFTDQLSNSFTAPETLDKMLNSSEQNVWAFGILLYWLNTKWSRDQSYLKRVFTNCTIHYSEEIYDSREARMLKQIHNCAPEWDWDTATEIGASAKNLISYMLIIDRTKRITMEDALKHPYFAVYGANQDQIKPTTKPSKQRGATRSSSKTNAPQSQSQRLERRKSSRNSSSRL